LDSLPAGFIAGFSTYLDVVLNYMNAGYAEAKCNPSQ
jgi:hypothetical protein